MSTLGFRVTLCLMLGVGFACGSLYALHQIVGFDQLQMLQKGFEVTTHGNWTPYGNLSSGGLGNTPGYLSVFVVAGPLMAWDSLLSPMLALGVLMLAAYLLLDDVIKQAYGDYRIRLFFGVLYWLNPWFLSEVHLWNPSYLFFLSAVHLWTVVRMHQTRSLWVTMIHVLAVGAAAQLHLSALILFFMSLYLYYRGVVRVHWGGVIIAVLIWLASLVPYFLSVLENPGRIYTTIEGEDYFLGRGLVFVYPFLKTILYWIRLGSTFFSRQLVFLSNFGWLSDYGGLQSFVEIVWKTVLVSAGVVSVWFSVIVNKFLWGRIKNKLVRKAGPVQSINELLMIYAFAGFASLIICGAISPISFSWWHVLIIFHCAILPVVFFTARKFSAHASKFKYGFGFLAAFFIAVNLVSAHGSGRYSYAHVLTEYQYSLP
ncbi:MAG: 3-deoxy-D-manno-octulosonic acid transferase [Gammaproteobacteria bacterium]|nr:3-deoxy-D-manno-octulosonic acid transferase [Gammaproteobacteria bacterium]MDH3466014.1 3-deoxy-D-manno-octulosonic acid transferase [Gammaproteobacteria bacterium]